MSNVEAGEALETGLRPLSATAYLASWRSAYSASRPSDDADDGDRVSYGRRAALREAVRASDTLARRLFASGRGEDAFVVPELVEEPFLGLIKVYEHEADFTCVTPTPAEVETPKVFPLGEARRAAGTRCVVSKPDFLRAYELFSENQLRDLDWTGVFAAGGSVLACLQPLPPECATSRQKRRYMHDQGFPGSDVDLFLYGLTPKQAEAKIQHIYDVVCDNCPFDVLCFRSSHAITMVSQYPYRHVQVVLRLYSSPSEVLNGFDVDSCAVGFDGTEAWVTQRAHQALTTQANPVDLTRRSPTYEMRLAKYASRGFEVLVPGLQRDRVDPMLMERPWKRVQGLAKLLLLERLRTPEARFRFKEKQRSQQMSRLYTSSFAHRFQLRSLAQSKHNAGRMEAVQRAGADASDYSTVFLPWGPGYTAAKCRKLMRAKDAMLNNSFLNRGRKYSLHPCFVGTAAEVMEDCSPNDPPIPKGVDPEELAGFVRGGISFIEDDPGRQMIGSFHPLDDDEWAKGTFFSVEAGQLCAATIADDVDAIKAALALEGITAGTLDFYGRTPLHIAALSGCQAATEVLLAAGADPTAPMADGRTPIHVAAAYGHSAILDCLLKHQRQQAGDAADEHQSLDKVLAARDWNFNMTALHYALLYGQAECAETLLAAGADPHFAWTIREETPYGGGNSFPVSPLLLAASVVSWDEEAGARAVRALIDAGCSATQLDFRLQTPLHLAVLDGNSRFLDILLQAAPAAKVCLEVVSADRHTPLSLAAAMNDAASLKVLLAAGASVVIEQEAVDATRQRATALLHQKRQDKYELQLLAQLGLNSVVQPLSAAIAPLLDGRSLHKAAKSAVGILKAAEEAAAGGGIFEPDVSEASEPHVDFECVKLLLAAGAPVNAVLQEGSNFMTATDSVEAHRAMLAARKESAMAEMAWVPRVREALQSLRLDETTGLIAGAITPATHALATLDANTPKLAWRRAHLEAAAWREQATALFAALPSLATGGNNRRERHRRWCGGWEEDEEGEEALSAEERDAREMRAADILLKVLRFAGGKRWRELPGGAAAEASEAESDDESSTHRSSTNRRKVEEPQPVQTLLQVLDGSRGNDGVEDAGGSAEPLLVEYSRLGSSGGLIPHGQRAQYEALFEAAWSGNEDAIRAATAPAEGSPPVWVAVKEVESGLTPYSAALLGGHPEAAQLLLDIAQGQAASSEPAASDATADKVDAGEDYTKVNNYSLASLAEGGGGSCYSDEDDSASEESERSDDEDGVGAMVAEVTATAAASRADWANALDAAKGVAIDSGTGTNVAKPCRPEELLFQTVKVPLQFRPDLLPLEWQRAASDTRLQLLPRMLNLLQGGAQLPLAKDPIDLLVKEFGKAVVKPSQYSWREPELHLPSLFSLTPVDFAIFAKDASLLGSILGSAAALMPAQEADDVVEGHQQQRGKFVLNLLQPDLPMRMLPLEAAIFMDDEVLVEEMVRRGGVGPSLLAVLRTMVSDAEAKETKADGVPPPRVTSVVRMAVQQGSPRVLAWGLGPGLPAALEQYLASKGPGAEAATKLAVLLPLVGQPFCGKKALAAEAKQLTPKEAAHRLAGFLGSLSQEGGDGLNSAHAAVAYGSPEFMSEVASICRQAGRSKELLEAMNEVKAVGDKDRGGRRAAVVSPLQTAAHACNVPMVAALLAVGASVDVVDPDKERGWNILTFAIASKQKEEVLLPALSGLMDAVAAVRGEEALAGMLVQPQGKQGVTPLMVAQTYDSAAVVETLLRRLPDEGTRAAALTCSSASGRMALHLALRGSRPLAAGALLAEEGQLSRGACSGGGGACSAGGPSSSCWRRRAANVEDLMGTTPVDSAQAKLSLAASKALPISTGRRNGSRRDVPAGGGNQVVVPNTVNSKSAAKEIACYKLVRGAPAVGRRAMGTFEAVVEARADAVEQATKAANTEQPAWNDFYYRPVERDTEAEEETVINNSRCMPCAGAVVLSSFRGYCRSLRGEQGWRMYLVGK